MKYYFEKIVNRTRRFFREFYKVPYCVPAWGLAEHLAILFCVFSGRIVQGKKCLQLYEQIKMKTGKSHVFGFNSGREAILAALRAGNIGDGDKVIMPSYCCETVAQAVVASGATIVFCDIGDDYNPDVDHILTLINPDVRAIIFPHMFGNPGHIDVLENELVKQNIRSEILLIDDAAQSFGARLNGKLVGTFGDAGIISFGPGKTMTATGGGLLITNRSDISEKLEGMPPHFFPITKKLKKIIYWVVFRRWRKFTLPFFSFFHFFFRQMQGDASIVYSLCNIDAAIGLKQLLKLDRLIKKRIERKKKLDDILRPFLRDISILPENSNPELTLNVATKYPVRFSTCSNDIQDDYKEYLCIRGIEMLNLYKPIHLIQPRMICGERLILSKTESVWVNILNIPVEPFINDRTFKTLICCFTDFKDYLIGKKQ